MKLSIERALQLGVEAHKAGKLQKADSLYTAILQAMPNHSDANHNMGVLAVGIGQPEESIPFFKAAIKENPIISAMIPALIES